MRKELHNLREEQQDLVGVTRAMSGRVTKMDHEIFGNGRPGMVERLSEVQVAQKLMLKALWMLGGAGLTVATGIFLALL